MSALGSEPQTPKYRNALETLELVSEVTRSGVEKRFWYQLPAHQEYCSVRDKISKVHSKITAGLGYSVHDDNTGKGGFLCLSSLLSGSQCVD